MTQLLSVVKIGGSILGKGVNSSIVDDVKKIADEQSLSLVHGGGDEVTKIAERLGKKQTFVVSPEGIRSRYTDRETMEIFAMVMAGKINKEIVSTLQRFAVRAIGLSGIDGGIIRAERKKKLVSVGNDGRRRIIDGGYTGRITAINEGLLQAILSEGYVPVVAPVALGSEYEFLNVDGDRAAAYVAGGLKSSRVIFLTNVHGLIIDEKLVPNLTLREAKELIPRIGYGMDKKILAAVEALQMGVGEAIICSGTAENPISSAISHDHCTVITL